MAITDIETIDIPFAKGLDQEGGDEWTAPGSADAINNGIFVKRNTIQKRPGTFKWSKSDINNGQSPTIGQGRKLYSWRNEFGVIDGFFLRRYSPTANKLSTADRVSPCVATRTPIGTVLSTQMCDVDMADANGFRVVAWTDQVAGNAPNLYAVIIDASTGAQLSSQSNIAAGCSRPRIIAHGSTIIILSVLESGPSIVYNTWTLGVSSAWSGQSTLFTGLASLTAAWDASYQTNNGSNAFVIGYEATGAAPTLRVALYSVGSTPSQLHISSVVGEARTAFTSLAVRSDLTDNVTWIAYAKAGTITGAAFNASTLAAVQAPFSFATSITSIQWCGVERANATVAFVSYGGLGGVTAVGWNAINTAGSFLNAESIAYNVLPLSKPLAVSVPGETYPVRMYGLIAPATTGQSSTFLAEFGFNGASLVRPAATVAPRISSVFNGGNRSSGTLCSFNNLGSPGVSQFVTAAVIAVSSAQSGGKVGLQQLTFDFDHPGAYASAELGGSLFIGGGVPSVYDGTSVVECGSLVTQDASSQAPMTATAAAGGSLTQAVTYSYVFVPEWYDAMGQRHQGQPSAPLATAQLAGGNNSFALSLGQIGLSLKTDHSSSTWFIVPYRTAFLNGAMSTVFYRAVSDLPPSALRMPGTGLSVSYTDTASDASIASHEQLYTTGGVLESDCPPSFVDLISHKNRIYGIGDDQSTIWYTTECVPGVLPRFCDALTIPVEEGGPSVKLMSMDDTLYVFKKDRIYYYYGSGPNELGQQNDLAGPVKLPVDVGCIDPRSVVLTPQGIVFQTRYGMALLDRGKQVHSDFASAVEDQILTSFFGLPNYPQYTVVASALHPSRPEVWFNICLSPANTIGLKTSGKTLIYNYRFNAWSTATYFDGDQGNSGAGMVSLLPANGRMYMATTYGQVYQEYTLFEAENQNAISQGFFDSTGAQYVQMSYASAWIKPNGRVQGYGRVKNVALLLANLDPADVQITYVSDYSQTSPQSNIWNSDTNPTINARTELQLTPAAQKVEAFQIQIVDAPGTGTNVTNTGQGPQLIALTADVVPYRRQHRRRAGWKG